DSQAEGKILRNYYPPDALLPQDYREDVGDTWVLHALRAKLVLTAIQGKRAAMRGLSSRAVYFQVTHYHVTSAPAAEVNEWVRDEHADGVEHVGVAIAVSNHQQVVRVFHFDWSNKNYSRAARQDSGMER